jgi:hypothetical protein
LLVEGLRRSGRDLSRLALVDALEALYACETGLTLPLSTSAHEQSSHIVAS